MKKKVYKTPSFKVIVLEGSDILAGSGEGSYNETLPKRQFGSPESGPEPDGDGYIWADAKRQGNRVIDDSEDW